VKKLQLRPSCCLPRSQQRFVMKMIDAVLTQAGA